MIAVGMNQFIIGSAVGTDSAIGKGKVASR